MIIIRLAYYLNAGASTDQMKKLRQLERENSELKKIVAEQTLDIRVLKDVAEGNF